jgi:carbon storage regulator
MLVLTRKTGEKIQIDSDITITVLETHGNRVRIGIEAPPHVSILRGELLVTLPDSSTESHADRLSHFSVA